MNNKEQIAKWRKDNQNPRLALKFAHETEMIDMLEQQQAQIDRLTKDNERLENEVEDLAYHDEDE